MAAMPLPAKRIVPEVAGSAVQEAPSSLDLGGRLVGSRLGLLLIPALMLAVGCGFLLMDQAGLRRSVESALRQRVTDQADHVARAAAICLDQAEPLLGELSDHLLADRAVDPAGFALLCRTLVRARNGIAYISFSGTDGSFRGVFADHDHDGELRLNHSWIESDGTTTRRISRLDADGGLKAVETRRDTGYDPRQRPFWAPGVAAHGPVWTSPYRFYLRVEPGVTCAMAVRDPQSGELLGVATVDFDLVTLSAVMRRIAASGPAGGAALLFTVDGEVLASSDPGGIDAAAEAEARAAVIRAANTALPAADETRFTDLAQAGGAPLLVGVRGIQVPDGPLWYAAIHAPRATLAAAVEGDLRRGLWVGMAAVVVAVAMALLLAHVVTRQKRLVHVARAAARAAEDRLQAMGSYTLVKELGQGGMGAVWKAEHQLLARPAALKLILGERIANNPEQRALALRRFEREAKATARLRSRNTVTLYDFGVAADGSFYYAMELLDGLDLDRLVARHGPQPAGRVVHILLQACNSLAEAHANGLVHRDIKPANLHLCRLGLEVDVVKVLDFGLVTAGNEGLEGPGDQQLTGVGMVTGTPAFMAPEQARGLPLDGRSDLYAIGCVAYWLLTGRVLFKRQDSMAVMLAHVNEPPPALPEDPALPPALAALVMALLAKRPDQRPPDALSVIAALRDIAVPERAQWSQQQAETWWRRHLPVVAGGTSRVVGDAPTVVLAR